MDPPPGRPKKFSELPDVEGDDYYRLADTSTDEVPHDYDGRVPQSPLLRTFDRERLLENPGTLALPPLELEPEDKSNFGMPSEKVAPLTELREQYDAMGAYTSVRQLTWLVENGYFGARSLNIGAIEDTDTFCVSFAFAYLERLVNMTDLNIREIAVIQAISNLDALKDLVVAYGYGQSDILQDSLTPLVELVKWIAGDSKDSSLTHQDLLVVFSDPHQSNDLVSTLRLITAVHVISNPEQWYAKYLLGSEEQDYLDLVTLCSRIDFNGTETDHAMIHALTSALNVHLRISYLGDVSFATSSGSYPARAPAQAARDAKGKGKARETIPDEGFVEFNYQAAIMAMDEGLPPLELLCRHGQYEILVRVLKRRNRTG